VCDDCQVEAGRIAEQTGLPVEVAVKLWTAPRRDAQDPAELTALEAEMERGANERD